MDSCCGVKKQLTNQNLSSQNKQIVSLRYARELRIPSDHFLCDRGANVVGLDFSRFRLIDMRKNECMMDMKATGKSVEITDELFERCRSVDYHFSIGTFLLSSIRAM
jgi:hypothetical protein